MTKTPDDLAAATDDQLLEMAGHEFLHAALTRLNITSDQLADVLGVSTQTVWRWARDPEQFGASSRSLDATARRVLIWMLREGRPACWPAPARAGWPLPDRETDD